MLRRGDGLKESRNSTCGNHRNLHRSKWLFFLVVMIISHLTTFHKIKCQVSWSRGGGESIIFMIKLWDLATSTAVLLIGRSCSAGGIQADVASTHGHMLQGNWCNWLFCWCWCCKMHLLGLVTWCAKRSEAVLWSLRLQSLFVCFVIQRLGERVRDQPQIGTGYLSRMKRLRSESELQSAQM